MADRFYVEFRLGLDADRAANNLPPAGDLEAQRAYRAQLAAVSEPMRLYRPGFNLGISEHSTLDHRQQFGYQP